ncbi:cytochrome c oxidase assembly protein COX19 [Drosophila rhopaloa]|uniref:Cytochrome c oxidase assembly protein COX19 n=1 Tax=Drosophila rhopaloa TaxID=1041015 RepID=A0A6P4EW98_DRORH|nr:cytochrome c oxidase assembly protein COX19 [Drosophila rhopaloa]
MTSQIYSQKKFVPTPPEKGSFPLDHEGLCKKQFLLYASCLRKNAQDTGQCRQDAQNYLACRMDNNLMERTEWSKLGFHDQNTKTDQKQAEDQKH